MDQQREERLKELIVEISQIFLGEYEKIFELEAFNKLRQRIDRECGIQIKGLGIATDLNKGEMFVNFFLEAIISDKEFIKLTKRKAQSAIKVSEKDRKFVTSLRVRFNDDDIAEIEGVYAGNASLDTDTPNANPETGSADDADTRSVDEVIASLKTLAWKLNLNLRRSLAGAFNTDSILSRFEVLFPGGKELENDSRWLLKIQEVINKIQKDVRGAGNIKKLLTQLENLLKIAVKSQEG